MDARWFGQWLVRMVRAVASEEISSLYSYVVPSSEQSTAPQMGSATTNAHARTRANPMRARAITGVVYLHRLVARSVGAYFEH